MDIRYATTVTVVTISAFVSLVITILILSQQ